MLNVSKRTSQDEDCISLLNGLLRKPLVKLYDPSSGSYSKTTESEASETETVTSENENENEASANYRKKFPFKQVYD